MSYNKSYRALFVALIVVVFGSYVHAQYGGTAGAFARIGFGPRGLSMGNAMTAVASGDLAAYYNPAIIAYQDAHAVTAAYTILSLDRKLNFIQYSQHLKNSAGAAIGFINSGVSNIDGRDGDGLATGALSTSENMFFATFANTFSEELSIGISFKYYFYNLYQSVSAYSLGADLGATYRIGSDSRLGICVQDIGVKYRWDTSNLYGEQGSSTIDEFPITFKIGFARTLFDSSVTGSIEYVGSSQKTHQARFGVEWRPHPLFTLRAGCDRIDLKDRFSGAMPTIGFGVTYPIDGWRPSIQYAFGAEPFSPSGIHMIAVTVGF